MNSKKNSNKMTLLYSISLIPVKSLYMLRAKQSPIIRSSIKLFLQHLVFINKVWPAVVVDESYTRNCKYSFIELLMMGDCFARNM
jgi:hypothetical protein